MPQKEHPTRGIKIWIWLGVAVLVFLIILPIIGIGYFAKEANRQKQCEGRSPKDPGCAPSFVWNVISWATIVAVTGMTIGMVVMSF